MSALRPVLASVPLSALDASTLPPSPQTDSGGAAPANADPCLVLSWSRDEPWRVGESLLVPSADPGPWLFGRGEPRADERRLLLERARPGSRVASAPLACPRVSRRQASLFATPRGGIALENLGTLAMLHNGQAVTRAELAVGDTLAFRNELSFVCARSAGAAQSSAGAQAAHAFGEADALGLVGESAAVWELRQAIALAAREPFHALIFGESGCGKELVAQAVHALSPRGQRALVARNAATIPEGLADAELFGNIKNYPNPGMVERPGLVGQAHDSTLFLDELAELPLRLQAHLLRVLDDGEYQRLGDAAARRANLRVLGATNRPLSELKPDLLARFKLRIQVPGLDARREDIPLLIAHLLRRHAAAEGSPARRFFARGEPSATPLLSPQLVEALVRHEYTTHVRELEALLVRAVAESRGRYLELPSALRSPAPAAPAALVEPGLAALTREERVRLTLLRKHRFSPTSCGRDPAYPGNRQTADLHLRQLICKLLELADYDQQRAAELLSGAQEPELVEKGAARIATFVHNLRERLVLEDEASVQRSLVVDWKGNADTILRLVGALRSGKLAGARPD